MGLFHTHSWETVTSTYAPPLSESQIITYVRQIQAANSMERYVGRESYERFTMGVTTFVLRCTHFDCGALKKMECLGKQIEGEHHGTSSGGEGPRAQTG